MKTIKSVCVYCGAYAGKNTLYSTAAAELGEKLAKHDLQLIYGGGRFGLMGIIADAVLSFGGKVTGFLPEHMGARESAHPTIQELHIVDSMHTRKLKMFESADALVIMPGGFGTLDELIEALTWKQLGMHQKPIILININNYWNPLQTLIQEIVSHGFADPKDALLIDIVSSVDEVFEVLEKTSDIPSERSLASPKLKSPTT